ncbi:MAG: hypothetical protein E6343_12800 [Clostridium perfringens]|nr:hypothetical protein [Clostridium perfringens]
MWGIKMFLDDIFRKKKLIIKGRKDRVKYITSHIYHNCISDIYLTENNIWIEIKNNNYDKPLIIAKEDIKRILISMNDIKVYEKYFG